MNAKTLYNIKIKLFCFAYFSSDLYRLPDEDGNDSEFYMEDEWLEAHAFDDQGQEYMIFWDLLPDWDGLDSDTACDWDHPRTIINFAPDGKSYDMSSKVVIVEEET